MKTVIDRFQEIRNEIYIYGCDFSFGERSITAALLVCAELLNWSEIESGLVSGNKRRDVPKSKSETKT